MQIFKNYPGEHAFGPPKTVTLLVLLQTNSAGKSTLKNVKLWCLPPKNTFDYVPGMKKLIFNSLNALSRIETSL